MKCASHTLSIVVLKGKVVSEKDDCLVVPSRKLTKQAIIDYNFFSDDHEVWTYEYIRHSGGYKYYRR